MPHVVGSPFSLIIGPTPVCAVLIQTRFARLINCKESSTMAAYERANEDVRAVRFSCCVGGCRAFAGQEGLRASSPAIRAKSRPRARSTSGIRVDNNLLIELKKRKDERAASSGYEYLSY